MTADGKQRSVTYRAGEADKLVRDIRDLLADHDAVELWGRDRVHHATVSSRAAVRTSGLADAAVVECLEDGETVEPTDVDELVGKTDSSAA